MNKKYTIILISAIVIVGILLTTLYATGIIPFGVYSDMPSVSESNDENKTEDGLKEDEDSEKSLIRQDLKAQDTSDGDISVIKDSVNSDDNEMQEEQVHYKKSENRVEVLNNSPEYEIEMYSYLDNSNNLCMEIDYYFDGVSHTELFMQRDFPEFENILDAHNEDTGNSEATGLNKSLSLRLSNAVLNTKYGKVYFMAERNLQAGEKVFLLYVLSLKDKTIKFLYQGEGHTLNTYLLSPDKEYIAFNLFKDEKGNSSLIHIFNSKDDTALVIDNMTTDGMLIGSDLSGDELLKEGKTVSYYLIRWRTIDDLKLREYSYVFDKTQNLVKDEQSYEVSYNVLKNTMIYPEEKYASEGLSLEEDPKSKTDEDTEADKDMGSGSNSNSSPSPSSDTGDDSDSSTEAEPEQDSSHDKGTVGSSNEKPDDKSDMQQRAESGTKSEKQDGTATDAETGKPGVAESKDESAKPSGTTSESLPESPIGEGSGSRDRKESINEADKTEDGNKVDNKVSTDSEQVAVLKNFYKYVAEGNYEKAYDLFDDNFESISKMFMGLKISKKEITLEVFQGVAETTQIFKNVKIENIIKEEQVGDSYKIYYTQSLALDPGSEPEIYPLIVTLKKVAGTWKIMTVDDGTPGEGPFK